MDALDSDHGTQLSAADDPRRFRTLSIIAALVALPFLISNLAVATLGVASFRDMYAALGGELPVLSRLVLDLAPFGVPWVVVLVTDVAIFLVLRSLARRYWIGLLFVPVLAYMGVGAVLALLLYWPMFNVVTLVK